ncbi:hypothetical protein HOG21_01405 [bacterium]|nr:hypothetical protein [bacterium]
MCLLSINSLLCFSSLFNLSLYFFSVSGVNSIANHFGNNIFAAYHVFTSFISPSFHTLTTCFRNNTFIIFSC